MKTLSCFFCPILTRRMKKIDFRIILLSSQTVVAAEFFYTFFLSARRIKQKSVLNRRKALKTRFYIKHGHIETRELFLCSNLAMYSYFIVFTHECHELLIAILDNSTLHISNLEHNFLCNIKIQLQQKAQNKRM